MYFCKGDYVHHLILIRDYPTQQSITHYIHEVRTDPDFALGDMVDTMEIGICPFSEALEMFGEAFGVGELEELERKIWIDD